MRSRKTRSREEVAFRLRKNAKPTETDIIRGKTMRKIILTTAAIAASLILGACGETPKPNATPTPAPSATVMPTTPSPTMSPTDDKGDKKAEPLAGKWTGVEGAYLNITKKDGDKFTIEIKDLDKAETFEGTAKGDVIEFTRKGKTETIKHATGEETGMKYLLEEKNCVVINKGSEGYCRKTDAK